MKRHFLSIFAISCVMMAAGACARAADPTGEIITQAIEAARRNDERAANYIYNEKVIIEKLDKKGKAVRKVEKNFIVMAKSGISYQLTRSGPQDESVLVAGQTLDFGSSSIAEKGSKTGSGTKPQSPAPVSNQAGLYAESMSMDDLASNYRFKLLGSDRTGGLDCHLLAFEPVDKPKARTRVQKIMSRMKGRLWIDKQSFQIVRCEAGLSKSMNLAWPFATLRQASLTYKAQQIPSGLWMPSSLELTTTTRAFLGTSTIRQTATMGNFRRLKKP